MILWQSVISIFVVFDDFVAVGNQHLCGIGSLVMCCGNNPVEMHFPAASYLAGVVLVVGDVL